MHTAFNAWVGGAPRADAGFSSSRVDRRPTYPDRSVNRNRDSAAVGPAASARAIDSRGTRATWPPTTRAHRESSRPARIASQAALSFHHPDRRRFAACPARWAEPTAGVQAIRAGNGVEAPAASERSTPDVVLNDMRLPEPEGVWIRTSQGA